MASISSLGVGAGIDSESIITQLMSIERQPITNVQSTITTLNSTLSTWGRIQSSFSALGEASKALQKTSLWDSSIAKSSNEQAVVATPGTNSTPGNYNITVAALAQSQFISTAAFASKSDPVGTGTLTIEFGTFADNVAAPPSKTFTNKPDSSAISIEIGDDDDTLEGIRDKINDAGVGITASIVNDASGARLVFRGASGESNAFKVSVAEGASPGLSALAYDPSADINNAHLKQAASNANATINGIDVTSESNTLTDVVDGLTLQLKSVTQEPASVTLSTDTATIKAAVDTFATAYNNAISTIRVQTLYDAESKTSGPLQGDSTALGLLRQLRSLAGGSTSATSAFDRLSNIGLTMKVDGTFSTDATKLGKALENKQALQKFFSATSETDAGAEGIAVRFANLSKQVTDSDGTIGTRTDSIKNNIKRKEANIDSLELRVASVEKRLRAQYTALDQTSSRLNGLSSYVTQQLAALNNTNN